MSRPTSRVTNAFKRDSIIYHAERSLVTAEREEPRHNQLLFLVTLILLSPVCGMVLPQPLSVARSMLTVAASPSHVVWAGGYTAQYIASDAVDILDISTSSWSSTSLPTGPRLAACAVSHGFKALFFTHSSTN